jgi:hypothetical protein
MGTRIRSTENPRGETWELAENDTMKLPRRRTATNVRADQGTVLVTREGDLEDHVLEPGDELLVPRGGLAVAWAFTAATVSFCEGLRASRPHQARGARGAAAPRGAEPLDLAASSGAR